MGEPTERELDEWMSRLSRGDRDAFDPLFRALHPRALRLARMTLAEDHADDAAQVVLMRVFARASEFQAGRPVLPWFYAIAANELHGARRRNAVHSSRQTEEAVGLHLAHEADPERSLLEAELRRCLEQALASLDESSADAIRFMLDGRRPERGAPAFRKRVSRAYAKLRLLLGGLYGR